MCSTGFRARSRKPSGAYELAARDVTADAVVYLAVRDDVAGNGSRPARSTVESTMPIQASSNERLQVFHDETQPIARLLSRPRHPRHGGRGRGHRMK